MSTISDMLSLDITASSFIKDDESGLHRNFEKRLEKLAPRNLTPNTPTTEARTMPTPTSSARSFPVRRSESADRLVGGEVGFHASGDDGIEVRENSVRAFQEGLNH